MQPDAGCANTTKPLGTSGLRPSWRSEIRPGLCSTRRAGPSGGVLLLPSLRQVPLALRRQEWTQKRRGTSSCHTLLTGASSPRSHQSAGSTSGKRSCPPTMKMMPRRHWRPSDNGWRSSSRPSPSRSSIQRRPRPFVFSPRPSKGSQLLISEAEREEKADQMAQLQATVLAPIQEGMQAVPASEVRNSGSDLLQKVNLLDFKAALKKRMLEETSGRTEDALQAAITSMEKAKAANKQIQDQGTAFMEQFALNPVEISAWPTELKNKLERGLFCPTIGTRSWTPPICCATTCRL